MSTLIFDLGGVCFTDGTRIATSIISQRFGLPEKDVVTVLKGEDGKAYRSGIIGKDEFWKRAKARLGLDCDAEELAEVWHSSYKPIRGMFRLLEKLKKAGHELFFLSDNTKERVEYLEGRYHFLEYFRAGLFSYEAGMTKDNPKIFLMLLNKLSLSAAQCIYIDDKSEMVERAGKLGMKSLLFSGPGRLEEQLRERGIEY